MIEKQNIRINGLAVDRDPATGAITSMKVSYSMTLIEDGAVLAPAYGTEDVWAGLTAEEQGMVEALHAKLNTLIGAS